MLPKRKEKKNPNKTKPSKKPLNATEGRIHHKRNTPCASTDLPLTAKLTQSMKINA